MQSLAEQKNIIDKSYSSCSYSTASSSNTTKKYEYEQGDNYEVIYDETSAYDPYSVLRVRHFDYIPTPDECNNIVIIVEASTVSLEDCYMRSSSYTSCPATPGMDCIGKVLYSYCDIIKPGDRVCAYLRNGGGNARYIALPSSSCVRLESRKQELLDITKIVCLIRTYVMAFQCLYYGITEPVKRYQEYNSLQGKSILITTGAGLVTEAIINIATEVGNCKKIYSVADKKHHEYLASLGSIPLDPEDDWTSRVKNEIDIVIDGTCLDYFHYTKSVFKKVDNTSANNNKLICVGMATHVMDKTTGSIPIYLEFAVRMALYLTPNAAMMKTRDQWEYNKAECEEDLIFLIKLTRKNRMNPRVAGKIPLRAVAFAHDKLQNEVVDGFLVCEPWLK